MDKLIIVGQVTGNREVAELPELDAYLTDGWRIKEIQATNAARKAYIADGHTIEEAMVVYPCTED